MASPLLPGLDLHLVRRHLARLGAVGRERQAEADAWEQEWEWECRVVLQEVGRELGVLPQVPGRQELRVEGEC